MRRPSLKPVFSFDRAELDHRLGVAGAVLVVALVIAATWWGPGAIAGVFGLTLTALVRATKPTPNAVALLRFGVVGAVLTFAAFEASGRPVESAILLGTATLLGGWFAGRGPAGPLLAIWTLIAMLLGLDVAAPTAALWFLGGSLLVVVPIRPLPRSRDEESRSGTGTRPGHRSFVVAKAVAVAALVLAGFAWVEEAPYWMGLTVLIVGVHDLDGTIGKAWARALGTLLGVGVGLLVVEVGSDSVLVLAVALVVLVYVQMLFARASYVIFSTALTAVVMTTAALGGAEVTRIGGVRLASTVVGAAIAVAIARIFLPPEEA